MSPAAVPGARGSCSLSAPPAVHAHECEENHRAETEPALPFLQAVRAETTAPCCGAPRQGLSVSASLVFQLPGTQQASVSPCPHWIYFGRGFLPPFRPSARERTPHTSTQASPPATCWLPHPACCGGMDDCPCSCFPPCWVAVEHPGPFATACLRPSSPPSL